ncbi:TRAP transporter small permease subunit [Rhodovulum sp. DZ06]|uniref:TRAP transporter small permease subunit n=1 Tax=Rhodovulum sp. DZ06 TaxID=3425126 RepID=UPI003D3282B4
MTAPDPKPGRAPGPVAARVAAPPPLPPPGPVRRGLDALTAGLNLLGAGLILAVMALVCADVAGRTFFAAPISGVPELVSLSIVAIVFLQAPQAVRLGRLTRSDAFLDRLAARSPRAKAGLAAFYDLVGAAVFAAILQASWPLFWKAWERGTFVGAVGDFMAPVWPVKLVILVGCAMLILRFGLRVLDAATGRADAAPEPEDAA